MRIGIDASCWSNGRGFGRFTRELLGAVAVLNTDDEFALFSGQQTAEEATFPDGWRVGGHAETASRAAFQLLRVVGRPETIPGEPA